MSLDVPESTLTQEELAKLARFRRELADALDAALVDSEIADVASERLLGRTSSGVGAAEQLTGTEATALLSAFTTSAKGLVPAGESGAAHKGLLATGGFVSLGRVNAASYGVVADGVTDDRAALKAAVDGAAALGADLFLPDGVIAPSKYVDIANKRNLRIFSSGKTTIRFRSADTGVEADGTALSNEQARSAFLLRYCSNVTIEGITFVGDEDPDINANIGFATYATHSVGTTWQNNTVIHGLPFAQDANNATSSTSEALAVSDGTVTLTGLTGIAEGHVYRSITIAGHPEAANNGTFRILTASGGTITYANPGAVADGSSEFVWTIDDADRGTTIRGCRFFACRRPLRTGTDSVIESNLFESPMRCDTAGRGTSFSISGETVTLVDRSAPFMPEHDGKLIVVAGATTGGNNLGPVRLTYVNSQTVTYANASGATETAAAATTWWIMNGDKAGFGDGTGAIDKDGSTITFTADDDIFHASDVGKAIRLAGATTPGNSGAYAIETVVSATQVTFTNASGASESFSGGFTVDGFDRVGNFGTSHMIYLFAGRSNVKISNNTFRGARTTAIKVSGSTAAIRSISIVNNTFEECATACTVGADDSQEHAGITIDGNTLINCGNNRPGWSSAIGIECLGAQGVAIRNNRFHYTRPAISKVDGRNTVTGLYGIRAARYSAGISQPLEDVIIAGNTFTSDQNRVSGANIISTPINADRVGQRAYWATAGTLTKSGDIMTLTHTDAAFGQSLVGCAIRLVNAPNAGNNGTFTVRSVGGSSTLTFENASGTGGAVAAGTYRITPKDNRRGGGLIIRDNQIHHVGDSGIQTTQCTAPEITGNVFSGSALIECSGDVSPRIAGNREINSTTSNARIRLNSGTSWPYIHDNLITNGNLNTSVQARDWGVGVDSGTVVDYPLQGKRGRAKPTQARQEMVFAYGSGWVDGDTVHVTGTTYTYKATSPGGGQFNSFVGLVSAIDAQANHDCADYGAQFSPSVTTQHARVRHTATSTTETGQIYMQVSTLNPTSGAMLRNEAADNAAWCYGRGAASSSGTSPDRSVVWSMQTQRSSVVSLVAENEAARALLCDGSKASGTIVCTTKANYVDADYMTIGDGINPPLLYEFDVAGDGVTGGRVQVNISTDTTAAHVAARLKTAIEANQPALAVTDNADGTLTMRHKLGGVIGNVTMTENVTHASHTVAGLSNGAAGGYRVVANGTKDPGCCAVIQHGVSDGTEEFRWVIH
jgi:hypothetical protein